MQDADFKMAVGDSLPPIVLFMVLGQKKRGEQIMSNKERAIQLLDVIDEERMVYVVGILENLTGFGEIPNNETIAAMKELENGGGECFDTLDELWKSLELTRTGTHSDLFR